MSFGTPFQRGKPGGPGRPRGSRNKISAAFIEALSLEWEQSGAAALKVMSKEEPGNFVKVVAALLPKEFEITDSRLNELSDEELDVLINQLRGKLRIAIEDVGGGEAPTIN